MPSEVILPRVDMDMTTGKIAKWFVEPGAQVTKGQPLFEIETDKAAMEIEAPASGTIRDLAGASGDDIPVGSVVAWIFAEGEAAVASFKLATSAEKAKGERARVSVEDHRFDSALPPPLHDGSSAPAGDATAQATAERPRATPMARRVARTQGINLAALKGTGPRGRIQAGDVPSATGHEAASIGTRPSGTTAVAAYADRSAPPRTMTTPASAVARPLNLVQLREGEGRPSLLIHGFGADINNWRPFLAGVHGMRPVYALDLPGHGASPLGAVVDFSTLVDAVEASLTGGNLGPVDLVGHSLGGAVAATLAGRALLDIRSLLLLSPAGLGPDVNGDFIRGFLRAASKASLAPWMHQLVADPVAITRAFVRATLKAREGTDLVVTQRRVAEAVFPDDTQAFSIRSELARLAIPTRVVFGTVDAIIPARHVQGLPGQIALHLLPAVGHMPHIESRETVAIVQAQMTGASP